MHAQPLRPLPLRCRILGALELAPMTILQLADSLDAGEAYVRRMIVELHKLGVLQETGIRRHGTGRPWKVWSVVA